MARTITVGNRLESAGLSTAPTQDCTIFFRAKPSWNSGDFNPYQFFEYTAGTDLLSFVKFSDNNVYAGAYINPNAHWLTVADTGLFSLGVWANWRLEVEGTAAECRLYKNGTLVGSGNSAGGVFAGLSSPPSLIVGDSAATGRPANTEIAELAEYNRILSAGESAVIEATGCPLNVRRGLVRYWPIIGRQSPESELMRGDGLTLVGTPAATSHPRTFLPYSDHVYREASALDVTLPLLAAGGAFYSPTITPGAVNITMPLLAAAGAFYAPTVYVVVPPGVNLTVSDSSVLRMTISDSLAQG